MASERWTAETELLVATVLEDVQPPESDTARPDEAFFADARRVLAALANAGLLIEPGGERPRIVLHMDPPQPLLRPLLRRACPHCGREAS